MKPRSAAHAPQTPCGAEDQLRERWARTIEVWGPRSSRVLTEEDARQIIENMVGFFGVLIEWKAKQHASASTRERSAA